MMRKAFLIITAAVLCVIMCMGLTSCSKINKTPDEAKILADYNAEYTDSAYANFSNVVINNEGKNDIVYFANVTFTGRDEYADYELDTTVYYNYIKKQGWVFDRRKGSDIDMFLRNGRTEEQIYADIEVNGERYIRNAKNIKVLQTQIKDLEFAEYVLVSWEEEKYDLYSEYTGVLRFFYKDGGVWEYDKKSIKSEKHKILNFENTIWRYKYNNRLIRKYPDFVIKSISDDNMTMVVEYGGVTYTGEAESRESFADGNATYYFPKGSEVREAWIRYSTDETEPKDSYYVTLGITGGYTDFHKVNQ